MSAQRRDLVCVLVLAAVCLLLRLPALDRVALNPDESQYEATAAYLLDTGTSAFSLPHTMAATFMVYETAARLFGPYAMTEVRILVLLISLASALLVYALLRRETNAWFGLAGGLVFLHLEPLFEGLTANREWSSGLFLLLGLYLYAESRRAGRKGTLWLLAGAGLASGVSLWFKLQAAYIVLAIPAALAWEALSRRTLRPYALQIAVYATGGLLATLLHFIPFLLVGALGDYLGSIVTDWSGYAAGGAEAPRSAGRSAAGLAVQHFYRELPFRSIFLAAYVVAALILAGALLRAAGRRIAALPGSDSRIAVAVVFYLVAAMLAIRMGDRYFFHYYLFMLPAVALLFGFALQLCRESGTRPTRAGSAVAASLILVLLADRLAALLPPLESLFPRLSAAPLTAAYLLVFCAVALWGLLAFRRWAPAALLVLLCLEGATLVVSTQRMETPPSLPHHRSGYSQLVDFVERNAAAGDRLFVWGWAPEIYSLTRMTPGSRFTICQYIVDDTRNDPRQAVLTERYAGMLMRDLRESEPRFIVDAAERSWTMAESEVPWLYRLDLYPRFELPGYLALNYRRVGELDGCVVYVRR